MRSLFGSVTYKCDHCQRPMEYEDIALRITNGKEETRLLGKQHYCETCAPVVQRTFLMKEAHE